MIRSRVPVPTSAAARALAITLIGAALGVPSAAAGGPATSAPPLSEVLGRAGRAHKPVLLEVGAAWCSTCEAVGRLLRTPTSAPTLTGFVVEVYDLERGEGRRVAERFRVATVPTLLVLDAAGNELARRSEVTPDEALAFAERAGRRAGATEAELRAELSRRPGDLELLWTLAERARGRGARQALQGWLAQIERADRGVDRRDAARASWERTRLELQERFDTEARAALSAHLERYPADGAKAAWLLAATGAERKDLEAAFSRVLARTGAPAALNGLAYLALGAGAHDAALAAARRQLELRPDDPNAHDTLAEVHSYRGERGEALAVARRGLAHPGLAPDLAEVMTRNVARFERGLPSPDVRRPSLGKLLGERGGAGEAASPAEAARHLLRTLEPSLTASCAAKAPGLDELYVRVGLGARRVESVELLEPRAPAALRACVEGVVRGLELPADSAPASVVFTFTPRADLRPEATAAPAERAALTR